MKDVEIGLVGKVAKESIKRENKWKDKLCLARLIVVMVSLVLITAMICGTVLAWHSITEKQYALNMQFAEMADIARGTKTYESDTKDGGIAIAGSNNTMAGGDYNGNSEDGDPHTKEKTK